jgi:adenylate cyclase
MGASQMVLRVKAIATDHTMQLGLVEGKQVRIGRTPNNECAVTWDREVSREHAVIEMRGEKVRVACSQGARNPILTQQGPTREFVIGPGGQFQIGQTLFGVFLIEVKPIDASGSSRRVKSTFDDSGVFEDSNPDLSGNTIVAEVDEFSIKADDLSGIAFADVGRQMELLCDLPTMIASAKTDVELAQFLVKLLLDAIPESVAVAAAQWDETVVEALKATEDPGDYELPKPAIMRVETRESYQGRFMPSRRLVNHTIKTGECTVHVWGDRDEGGQFTMSDSLNWAFCVPVPSEACEGWCLYISGEGGKDGAMLIDEESLKPDIRFTQLLAQFIGSIRSVRDLQDTQTQLSSFFSPTVMENLTGKGTTDVLTPSERDITVLFCDVRGFSRKSEQHQDNLLYLLNCVKAALGCMTNGILAHNGAIADFQGDAALGFWGWPVELDDGAVPACLAGLAIQDEFNHPERHDGLMDGFSVGLGIAHGRAVSGQIGTTQQAKIGVFGPVVNQGARLETMTKQFGVSIIIDEASAEFARKRIPPTQARVRKLARVRPKGMEVAITVSQMLPPVDQSEITAEHLATFEQAVDSIVGGNWEEGTKLLNALQGDDGPKDFLFRQMARTDNAAPADWDGAFALTEK